MTLPTHNNLAIHEAASSTPKIKVVEFKQQVNIKEGVGKGQYVQSDKGIGVLLPFKKKL